MAVNWMCTPRGACRSSFPHVALLVCDPCKHSCHASVGRQLESFTNNWDRITSDVFMRNIVHHGYSLEFARGTTPPLSRLPFAFDLRCAGVDQEILDEAMQKLLDKNRIKPVMDDCSPGFYSRLFLVPKIYGGQRLVIDSSHLNSYLDVEHFKMETPATIMVAI